MRVELKSVILLLTHYTSGLSLSVEVIVGKWCNSCVKKYTFVYICFHWLSDVYFVSNRPHCYNRKLQTWQEFFFNWTVWVKDNFQCKEKNMCFRFHVKKYIGYMYILYVLIHVGQDFFFYLKSNLFKWQKLLAYYK